MNNIDNYNKVKNKIFEIMFQFSQIDQICKTFVTNIEQENIDRMVEIIQSYQKNNELLQNYMFDFLNEMTQSEESLQFNAEESDDGYKI